MHCFVKRERTDGRQRKCSFSAVCEVIVSETYVKKCVLFVHNLQNEFRCFADDASQYNPSN